MRKLFGTDGIRGVANIYPMTIEIAMQVGRAIAFIVKDKVKGHRIVIGKDTRQSCYMLENALAAGICSMESTSCWSGRCRRRASPLSPPRCGPTPEW